MVKKRFATLAIALLAVVSVVGGGFAAWHFGGSTRADDVSFGVILTSATGLGTLTVTQPEGNLNVKLDQSSTDEGGISFVSLGDGNAETAINSLTATWNIDNSKASGG